MYTPLVGIYILGAIILGPWRGRSDLLLTKMKKIGTETQIDFGSRILRNFNKRWNGSVLRMRELSETVVLVIGKKLSVVLALYRNQ